MSSEEQVTAGRSRRTLALARRHRATHARARRRPDPRRAHTSPTDTGMTQGCVQVTLPVPEEGRGGAGGVGRSARQSRGRET